MPENPSDFERRARKAMEKKLGVKLPRTKLTIISDKKKSFDMANEKEGIIGDAKRYTRSGNWPSAKISTLNEYVWIMQMLRSRKWKEKFIVMGGHRKLADEYVDKFRPWLKDVKVYFLEEGAGGPEEL